MITTHLTRYGYVEDIILEPHITFHAKKCTHAAVNLQMLGDDLVAEPDVVASEEIMEAKLH